MATEMVKKVQETPNSLCADLEVWQCNSTGFLKMEEGRNLSISDAKFDEYAERDEVS